MLYINNFRRIEEKASRFSVGRMSIYTSVLFVDTLPFGLFEQRACAFAYDLAPSTVPVFVGKFVDMFK